MKIRSTDALIVVDVQNDFCPGGALAVADGDRVVPIINGLLPHFQHVFFTRDWHPANHCSFANEPTFVDGSWPAHCIKDTPGAEFHKDLNLPENPTIVSTGEQPDKEAYSGFAGTDLKKQLRDAGIKRVAVCGLATDYCVKHTALDARKADLSVVVVSDAIRGVNNPPGSVEKAMEAMREAGVTFQTSDELSP